MARLSAIVQQTYESTQDCQFVQGLRSIDDVLAGYKAVGIYDASRWFLVSRSESEGNVRDVGCLLLTEHPAEKNWELIYFGVVPLCGARLGIEIVRQAQWLTCRSRAERFAPAVDAANSPAIAVYAAAGFEVRGSSQCVFAEVGNAKPVLKTTEQIADDFDRIGN